MTAVKAGDVERMLSRRPPDASVLLFYGPDQGLVSERAAAAASSFVDDPNDGFQLVRLSGDLVADEPGRLVEEASTFGLFGARRAIWLRSTARNIAPAVSQCLHVALADTLIVVEAGDLGKTSPLRLACEASPRALACPCYGDEERDLQALVKGFLSDAGLSIDADTLEVLRDGLGGDRLATRCELQKLALYMHGQDRVELPDVHAVISNVSGTGLDEAIDAAFSGDHRTLDAALGRLGPAGGLSGVLPLLLRHALALLASRGKVDAGENLEGVLRTWRGSNTRRAGVGEQLRTWSAGRLVRVVAEIQAAILEGRRSTVLGDVSVRRTAVRIAGLAAAQAVDARRRRQRPSS